MKTQFRNLSLMLVTTLNIFSANAQSTKGNNSSNPINYNCQKMEVSFGVGINRVKKIPNDKPSVTSFEQFMLSIYKPLIVNNKISLGLNAAASMQLLNDIHNHEFVPLFKIEGIRTQAIQGTSVQPI